VPGFWSGNGFVGTVWIMDGGLPGASSNGRDGHFRRRGTIRQSVEL